MAKTKEKNLAFALRKKGRSLREISEELMVCKSTVSLWCRDIELSPKQSRYLQDKMKKAAHRGAIIQHERRLERIRVGKMYGVRRIKKLSKRDLLLSGLAFYWGEGTKKTRQVRVSNSDPTAIKLMIRWFREIWGIEPKRFILRIGINIIHKNRVAEVEKYWSKQTGIPQDQFGKTTLIRVKNKKTYKNLSTHYGTARLEVRRPAEIYYKIMGLIEALSRAGE